MGGMSASDRKSPADVNITGNSSPAPATPAAEAAPEQRIAATWIAWGVRLGLLALAATAAVYFLGLAPSRTPTADWPLHWGRRASELAAAVGHPRGWEWLVRWREADALAMLGIAWLCTLPLVVYVRLALSYGRRRDWVYLIIAALEIAVMLAAAGGVFQAGAH